MNGCGFDLCTPSVQIHLGRAPFYAEVAILNGNGGRYESSYMPTSRPPHRGCGLKSTKPHHWHQHLRCHPPCGGCGLKYDDSYAGLGDNSVALRTEGVG